MLNLVDLLENGSDKESVGDKVDKDEADDKERMIETANVSKELQYRVDLALVNVVLGVVPDEQVDEGVALRCHRVLVASLIIYRNEIIGVLLSKLKILVRELHFRETNKEISALDSAEFHLPEELVVNVPLYGLVKGTEIEVTVDKCEVEPQRIKKVCDFS